MKRLIKKLKSLDTNIPVSGELNDVVLDINNRGNVYFSYNTFGGGEVTVQISKYYIEVRVEHEVYLSEISFVETLEMTIDKIMSSEKVKIDQQIRDYEEEVEDIQEKINKLKSIKNN